MGRILRLELRRSAALGLGLLTLAVGLAIAYASPQDWAGRWMALAGYFRNAMFVLWPLALAGGAWQVRRERRCRVEELFATVARPARHRRLMTAFAPAIAVVAGYLAALLGAGALVAPTASHFPPDVVVVLAVGALSLLAGVWIGAGVGRALPYLLTAPTVAMVGFVGLFAAAALADQDLDRPGSAPRFVLLSPVLRAMRADAYTVAGRVNAAQAIWMGCLAAAGLGLLNASSRRSMVAFAAVAVVGTAVALPVLPASGATAYPVDPVAAGLVCTDGAPRVCVRKVHARLLNEVTPPARQALALLAKLPDPPTTAVEVLHPKFYGSDGKPAAPPGTVLFEFEFSKTGGLAKRDDVTATALEGAGTTSCWAAFGPDGGGMEDEAARDVAGAWLQGRGPEPSGIPQWDELVGKMYRDLTALPGNEQLRRVVALRKAGLACEKTLYRALTGATS